MTFMNLSGDAVAPLYRKHADGPGDLLVLHDDLDLPAGAVRLKRGGGTGGHNGLRSIKERLGTAEFLRIRVGIGRPPAETDPADYVLTPPAPELRGAFDAAVAAAGFDAAKASSLISSGSSARIWSSFSLILTSWIRVRISGNASV